MISNSCILSLLDVKAGYGALEVLHGISLEIQKGEIVTLIGANGAGKSTTLKTICGMVRAQQGTIHFKDRQGKKT